MSVATRRRGRHAAPRPRRVLWLTAPVLAVAVVVVAAALGGSGTFALWTASASTRSSSVRSGTATIAVGSLGAMDTARLGPGGSAKTTFTVANTGSVPLSMRVQTTATSVTNSSATSATVLGELTLTLSVVATAADCHAGLGGASARLATFDTGTGYYTMPPGAKGMGCVEVDLDQDAPQSVAGAVAAFELTVTGTQVPA